MPLFFWRLPIGRLSRGARIAIALVCGVTALGFLAVATPTAVVLSPPHLIVAFFFLCSLACIKGPVGSIAGRIVAAVFAVAVVGVVINETREAWHTSGASALISGAVWGPFLAFLAWGVPCGYFAVVGRFPFMSHRVSVEKQMKVLRSCGISLSRGVRLDDLLRAEDPEILESLPYFTILIALGGNTKDKRRLPLCPKLWLCHSDGIETADSYTEIIRRLALMCDNPLTVANVRSQLSLDAVTVSVDFDAGADHIHWDLAWTEDRIDPELFIRFDKLLADKTDLRLYVSLALEDQSRLVGCFTASEYTEFSNISALPLYPLSDLHLEIWRSASYDEEEEPEATSH